MPIVENHGLKTIKDRRCIFNSKHGFTPSATFLPSNTLLLMGATLHVVSEESKDTMWFFTAQHTHHMHAHIYVHTNPITRHHHLHNCPT